MVPIVVPMQSRERFLATIERKPVDRPACWLGVPDRKALPGLFGHFGVDSLAGLKARIGDDVYHFELPYEAPGATAIEMALNFAKDRVISVNEARNLSLPGVFEEAESEADFDSFDWPDPARHISPDRCRAAVAAAPADKAVMGVLWSSHFQDACAAFGMENAFVKMLTEPNLFRILNRRIVDFYLAANQILYEAAADSMDAVLIGNDFGSQQGLMVSPSILREWVLPETKRLVDQAKSYGLKVVHHSCGSIAGLIPDLIAIGVDAIHPIQALASGMEPEKLKRQFGAQVSFFGGVDAQYLLVRGLASEVVEKVLALKALFPTGLVISPSHEAILADTKPENIEALFAAARA